MDVFPIVKAELNEITLKRYQTEPCFRIYIYIYNLVSTFPYFQIHEKYFGVFTPKTKHFGGMFIGLVGRVFPNGPGDLDSIPGRVIPKTLKMVLDTSLLNTQ